jgi:hypothetical protein
MSNIELIKEELEVLGHVDLVEALNIVEADSDEEKLEEFKKDLKDNGDGTYDVEVGDITIPKFAVKNGKLLISFKNVSNSFYCSGLKLNSLEGCPEIVGNKFICRNNNLSSLKYAPTTVGSHFNCAFNNIKSLKYSPVIVGGNFSCSENILVNLEGAPKKTRVFDCSNNNLVSLKGAPEYVDVYFDCRLNNLSSIKALDGMPKTINGNIYCGGNPYNFDEDYVRSICDIKGSFIGGK